MISIKISSGVRTNGTPDGKNNDKVFIPFVIINIMVILLKNVNEIVNVVIRCEVVVKLYGVSPVKFEIKI